MNEFVFVLKDPRIAEFNFFKKETADFDRTQWRFCTQHPLVSGYYEVKIDGPAEGNVEIYYANWTGSLWVNVSGVALPEKLLNIASWRGLTRDAYEEACKIAQVTPRTIAQGERRLNADRRNGEIREGSDLRGRRFEDLDFEDLPSGLPI